MVRHAVAIGGGHGLARSLAALKGLAGQVTAVVTVADDGGSSGRLRRDLGVLPPGDLRKAMSALAPDSEGRRLLDYRFEKGELDGHSLGNLLLVALADLEGGLVAALDRLGALLQIGGRVLPSTTVDVTLHGAGPDGHHVDGQVAVATTVGVTGHRLDPPSPAATPDVLVAIADADLVVLGPGSVCTSILPNLLVPEVAAAVAGVDVPVVLVGNLDQQTGEGEGRSLADHVRLFAAHGVVPDVVLAHGGAVPPGGRRPLGADDELRSLVARVVVADLLAPGGGHDDLALGAALRALVA